MSWLNGWLERLSYFMVLFTIFLELAPGESYKRYLQIVIGFAFILLVLSPLFTILSNIK